MNIKQIGALWRVWQGRGVPSQAQFSRIFANKLLKVAKAADELKGFDEESPFDLLEKLEKLEKALWELELEPIAIME